MPTRPPVTPCNTICEHVALATSANNFTWPPPVKAMLPRAHTWQLELRREDSWRSRSTRSPPASCSCISIMCLSCCILSLHQQHISIDVDQAFASDLDRMAAGDEAWLRILGEFKLPMVQRAAMHNKEQRLRRQAGLQCPAAQRPVQARVMSHDALCYPCARTVQTTHLLRSLSVRAICSLKHASRRSSSSSCISPSSPRARASSSTTCHAAIVGQ